MAVTGRLRPMFPVWRRVFSISWPVMAQHVLRTLMRTVDIFVTGLFSPAAISAIGLADLYARFPLRIGLGLGGGAIALSSQETGRGDVGQRDEAITQAILIGAIAGLPFMLIGVLFGEWAIKILGASDSVARMGGLYLAILFLTSPFRHVGKIAEYSLQGTGDTVTPMVVSMISNLLNIIGSLVLGLGLGPFPRMAIVGVGIATAIGNIFTAVVLVGVIALPIADIGFRRPSDPTITKQLFQIGLPKITDGLAQVLAEFPFNALLLVFGTEVNAAYQVGRRIFQQITAPLSRGIQIGASIIAGQALGAGDQDRVKFEAWSTAAFGVATVGVLGILLTLVAEPLVLIFTRDPLTVLNAEGFVIAYGIAAPFHVVSMSLSGTLEGASETRLPFIARVTGLFGFFVGFSYLTSVVLGWGVVGILVGIVLYYLWMVGIVILGFSRIPWIERAGEMMDERAHSSELSIDR